MYVRMPSTLCGYVSLHFVGGIRTILICHEVSYCNYKEYLNNKNINVDIIDN